MCACYKVRSHLSVLFLYLIALLISFCVQGRIEERQSSQNVKEEICSIFKQVAMMSLFTLIKKKSGFLIVVLF